MLSSFVVTKNDGAKHLSTIKRVITSQPDTITHVKIVSTGHYSILLKWNEGQFGDVDQCLHQGNGNTVVFSGDIKNQNELSLMLSIYDRSSAPTNGGGAKQTLPAAHLVFKLYTYLGRRGLSLIEGSFAFVVLYNDGRVEGHRDDLGMMPLHYSTQLGNLWIFNEVKLLIPIEEFSLKLNPRDAFDSSTHIKDDFSIFVHIQKVPAAGSCKADKEGKITIEGGLDEINSKGFRGVLNYTEASQMVDGLLRRSVKSAIGQDTTATVLLSGGVDSSFVTGLAAESVETVNTISMGTTVSNEFDWAKIASDHVGTKHHELLFSDEDIMQGLAEVVYENELYDGLSAEIHAPMLHLYKFAASMGAKKVLTGYGADLLFGGTIKPTDPLTSINPELCRQIYRTTWTGEFNPFLASRYGVKVEFPFWNNRLMDMAVSLDPSYKTDGKEIKTLLRQVCEAANVLPSEIVWRKKIGIHEASSINKIFAKWLDIPAESIKDYKVKDSFVYMLFQQLFEHRIPLSSINLKQLAVQCVSSVGAVHTNEKTASKEPIVIETTINDSNVRLITFNHNNKLNPFSEELSLAVRNAIIRAEEDDNVRAVVLTGGNGRSFSCGGDFNEVKNFRGGDEVSNWIDGLVTTYSTIAQCKKPTISAVDGHCIGVGFQVAMMTDFRIATPNAKFHMPELKHGITCTLGVTILGQSLSRMDTATICLGCEPVPLETAVNIGLVKQVVSENDLINQASILAGQLGKYDQTPFTNTKRLFNRKFIAKLIASAEESKAAHRKAFAQGAANQTLKRVLKHKY